MNVWIIVLCIIVPKHHNFSAKMKYCDLCLKGQVLSHNPGQVLSLTLFMIHCRITLNNHYLQMIMEPTGDQGSPRSLLQ